MRKEQSNQGKQGIPRPPTVIALANQGTPKPVSAPVFRADLQAVVKPTPVAVVRPPQK